jgi:hypothetical protein
MSVVDPVPAARGVRTRGLGWSMLWAVVLFLVTNLGALLTQKLTTVFVTPLQTAVVSTAVSLVVVLVGVIIDYAKGRQPPDPAGPTIPPATDQPYPAQHYPPPYSGQPYPHPGQPYRAPSHGQTYPRRGRGGPTVSLLTALALVLLLCGGGAFGATLGVQSVISAVTGLANPTADSPAGDARLVNEVSATAGALKVTVTGVRTTGSVTLVDLVGANSGSETMELPVFMGILLSVPGATTLQGDPARSNWAQAVPAEGELRGTIAFGETLGPDVTSVSLSFTVIYGGPRSLTIKNIPLRPA